MTIRILTFVAVMAAGSAWYGAVGAATLEIRFQDQSKPPAITIQDAIEYAKKTAKEQKIDRQGKHIASAVFVVKGERPHWEVMWKPNNRRTLGGWFVVRVFEDKSTTIVKGQ